MAITTPTLNANFAGAAVLPPRGRLVGTERGLDALIGLVIIVAEVLIGFLTAYALFMGGVALVEADPSSEDRASIGLGIAVFGGAIPVIVTTLIYLVRVIMGRRSWTAPLVGAILMTVVLFVGYIIMASD